MVFSSLQFILIFMPLFFVVYTSVPKSVKNFILLCGSLIFYFAGTVNAPFQFVLFVMSMIIDFTIALGIERCRGFGKRALLIVGVGYHLISLCTFKYSNFIISELSGVLGIPLLSAEIILPIGISFYTFQGISYIADVYRGGIRAETSLLKYAVYISMFEQLIAGPIVVYGDVKNELDSRCVSRRNLLHGISVFIFGLGLKVLLANPLGKLWSQTVAIGFESISTPLAWIAIFAYSFQIYFDFFGYSLMAIGLGEMLGFTLPENFRHPYVSKTMTEFWRRWHITLGTWFREYVYIPLGGNRCGRFRTILNLALVWTLTGIWHGAGYNFLLWGVSLFLIITAEKFVYGKFLEEHPLLGHIYMLILISVTWSIFAINDISSLAVFLGRLFPFFGQGVWSTFRLDYLKYLKLYAPFLVVGAILSFEKPYRLLEKIKSRAVITLFLAAVAIASIYCLYRGFDDPFLYFRF